MSTIGSNVNSPVIVCEGRETSVSAFGLAGGGGFPLYRAGKVVQILHGPENMKELIVQITERNDQLFLELYRQDGMLAHKDIEVRMGEKMSLTEIKMAVATKPGWGVAIHNTGEEAFIGRVSGLMGGMFNKLVGAAKKAGGDIAGEGKRFGGKIAEASKGSKGGPTRDYSSEKPDTLRFSNGFLFEIVNRSTYKIMNADGIEILCVDLAPVAHDPGALRRDDISVFVLGPLDLNIAYRFGGDRDLMHAIAIRGGCVVADTRKEYWMHKEEKEVSIAWTAENTVAFTHDGRTELLNFSEGKWHRR